MVLSAKVASVRRWIAAARPVPNLPARTLRARPPKNADRVSDAPPKDRTCDWRTRAKAAGAHVLATNILLVAACAWRCRTRPAPAAPPRKDVTPDPVWCAIRRASVASSTCPGQPAAGPRTSFSFVRIRVSARPKAACQQPSRVKRATSRLGRCVAGPTAASKGAASSYRRPRYAIDGLSQPFRALSGAPRAPGVGPAERRSGAELPGNADWRSHGHDGRGSDRRGQRLGHALPQPSRSGGRTWGHLRHLGRGLRLHAPFVSGLLLSERDPAAARLSPSADLGRRRSARRA